MQSALKLTLLITWIAQSLSPYWAFGQRTPALICFCDDVKVIVLGAPRLRYVFMKLLDAFEKSNQIYYSPL